MARGFREEVRLVQAVRTGILHGLTGGHWVAQVLGLEFLHALTAGPSAAPSAAYLVVVDAEQVR
jgi:hypothetical protein